MGWVSALRERRLLRRGVPLALLLLIVVAVAAGTAIGTTTTCSNPATLSGSAFEIDTNANHVVDSSRCKDWLNTGQGPGPIVKADSPSGAKDESFCNGTKEDTANLPS
jgi:hypothetical protein